MCGVEHDETLSRLRISGVLLLCCRWLIANGADDSGLIAAGSNCCPASFALAHEVELLLQQRTP
eukprot:CAMPEP_0181175204 /NCGR_PEP_ID=MMETSP1096-20121128/3951_1 /TAXON_ID=156174 ORGANISM="Chrysochromulina ericina, Strain CCMP281" /NCGR_SAMPLE_ID=MMETSP1096 /ASSEMBLY_ACC=CAM_ASM_000453 /LENGTH=63 /DNA_ID=CAMNT_0023263169 /DNA_START=330 /DNA_END=517 /DNA_ORIENTATION=+